MSFRACAAVAGVAVLLGWLSISPALAGSFPLVGGNALAARSAHAICSRIHTLQAAAAGTITCLPATFAQSFGATGPAVCDGHAIFLVALAEARSNVHMQS